MTLISVRAADRPKMGGCYFLSLGSMLVHSMVGKLAGNNIQERHS